MQNKKYKIALICDVRNWAFSNIAQEIKKNLGCDFHIDVFYSNEDYKNIYDLYRDTILKDYDLVHFFWRLQLFNVFNPDILKNCSIPLSDLIENFCKKTITTSVYDHAFLSEFETKYYQGIFSVLTDSYTVSSKRLFGIYKKNVGYKTPNAIIQDGVNLDLFYPKNIQRFSNRKTHSPIVIGWVGNSKWALKKGMDNKGLRTIINPAIKDLRSQGYKIISDFADRNIKFIPLNEMNDYYSKIDVLICASDIEGTPNPVLEAMACGIPVISTNVGIVSEVLGPKQSKFIFKRSPKHLSDKIKKLIDNPGLLESLSKENLNQISKFTRIKESNKWKQFFIDAIKKSQTQDYLQKASQIGEYIYKQENDKLDEYINKLRLKVTIAKKIKIGLYIEKL